MNTLRIRRHIFIGIIFIGHVACITSNTPLVINCILVYRNTLHLLLIIKTIIEHHNLSSTCARFTNCGYATIFLLRMYWLIWTVVFHFVVSILSESTRALSRYYHLLLHTWWWSNTISLELPLIVILYCSTWNC